MLSSILHSCACLIQRLTKSFWAVVYQGHTEHTHTYLHVALQKEWRHVWHSCCQMNLQEWTSWCTASFLLLKRTNTKKMAIISSPVASNLAHTAKLHVRNKLTNLGERTKRMVHKAQPATHHLVCNAINRIKPPLHHQFKHQLLLLTNVKYLSQRAMTGPVLEQCLKHP